MRSEVSFGNSAGAGGARSAGLPMEASALAGGVQWLGVRAGGDRTRRDGRFGGDRSGETVILGAAHGPRLLELVCRAG